HDRGRGFFTGSGGGAGRGTAHASGSLAFVNSDAIRAAEASFCARTSAGETTNMAVGPSGTVGRTELRMSIGGIASVGVGGIDARSDSNAEFDMNGSGATLGATGSGDGVFSVVR